MNSLRTVVVIVFIVVWGTVAGAVVIIETFEFVVLVGSHVWASAVVVSVVLLKQLDEHR